jgi:Outer membrane protein beta-barrel domain
MMKTTKSLLLLRRLPVAAVVAAACLAATALPARAQTPFYLGAHLAGHRLSELNHSRVGYGFRAGYEAYLPFISLETEVNFFPTTAGGNLGETQAFFGLKFGTRVGRWGGFIKARPGFTHFGGGAFPTRLTERTKFALDFGAGVVFGLSPKLDLRLDVGDTQIHYGNAALLATPGGAAGARLGTHHTLQSSFGLVVHF